MSSRISIPKENPTSASLHCVIPATAPLKAVLLKSEEERMDRFLKEAKTFGTIVPKDLSCRINTLYMDLKESNSDDKAENAEYFKHSVQFFQDTIKIAKRRDFDICIQSPSTFQKPLLEQLKKECSDLSHVRFIWLAGQNGETWTEDSGHFTLAGEVVGLPLAARKYYKKHQNYLLKKRTKRMGKDEKLTDFSNLGQAAKNDSFYGKISVSLADKLKHRTASTYIEGGNIFSGFFPDGNPFVIAGIESKVFTESMLKREWSRSFSETEIHKLFAADFGIKPENLFFIEQPRAFHLDMRMALLGKPGQLLLNDPLAAFEISAEWFDNELSQYKFSEKQLECFEQHKLSVFEQSEREALFNQKIIEQLKKYPKITVIQKPVVFHLPSEMNFINGEAGTDSNGRSFFITGGGPHYAEDYVYKHVFKPLGIELELMQDEATEFWLSKKGGPGCRMKAMGSSLLA